MKGRLLPASFLIALRLVALGLIAPPASYAGEVYPWGITRIGADIVHGYNKGTAVKVAILDSGIDVDHPDLNIAGGINFHTHVAGQPPDPNNYDDEVQIGCGTALAGIVAALSNGVGIIGVAPEVDLYAVRVVGWYDSLGIENYIAGIHWCIDPDGDGDASDKMDVLCLGLEFSLLSYDYPELHAACDAAWEAGCVVVAGAGNRGDDGTGDSMEGVGRYESVIAVGATDNRDRRWSQRKPRASSATGPNLELMAPGSEITTTLVGGGYGLLDWEGYGTGSGTSMAAAHVAGVAALVIAGGIHDANGNGRINDEVRQRLIETADDLGDPGFDWKFGYGIVDADEAAPPGPVNQPPIVTIASPLDGSTFDSGTSIYFEGTASDPEDGDRTGTLMWESSIDGEIGVGGSFSAVLSDGTHTITASAADLDGAIGSSSVTITVGSLIQLNVVAETDKYLYTFGETVHITVTVTDGTGSPIQGAAVHTDILTPNAKHYTNDGITDANGLAEFTYKPKIGDGQKIYTLTATASKTGCEPGSGSTTFYVYKP